jgi:PAS domain S-box-containing protein
MGTSRERKEEMPFARILDLFASVVALVAFLALPSVYFAISWSALGASLATEVEIRSGELSRELLRDPAALTRPTERLRETLRRGPGAGEPGIRRILDLAGGAVAESGESPPSPVLYRSVPVRVGNRQGGWLVVGRSWRPLLLNTMLLSAAGALLAAGILAVLRLLPMRALRRAFDLLAAEKETFQVTLHTIGDAVVTTDAEGRVVYMNPAAEKLLGLREQDGRGRPAGEVIPLSNPETGEALPPFPTADESLAGVSVRRVFLLSRDGVEHLVEQACSPIREGQGGTPGAVMVIRDLTEASRREEELLRARKMESLGILAGGIAHDFNNFLAGIMGNLSLARLSAKPGTKEHDRIGEAIRATDRARELALKLLTFAKGGKPIRDLVPLGDLVRESAGLSARGRSVRLETEVEPSLPCAYADPGQVAQVVSNLVINAVQASPEGSTVRVTTRKVVVGELEIPHVRAGEYVQVRVTDQGRGIAPENLARVFDPYFTTKSEGTGLGLTSCYNIMKGHGGNIFVESELGAGTTFTLYFPSAGNGQGEHRAEVSPGDEEVPMGQGRVLVMDDEELIRGVALGMLDHLGYQGASARDGEEAIALYRQAAAEGTPFDAVVMDLTIQGGMGGKEAAGHILRFHPEARLVVSSGYSEDPVMAHYRDYGFRGIVAKPYRVEDLGKVIASVLSDRPIADA